MPEKSRTILVLDLVTEILARGAQPDRHRILQEAAEDTEKFFPRISRMTADKTVLF
jgi:hypothetical protein